MIAQLRWKPGEWSHSGAFGDVIENSALAGPSQACKFDFAELSIKGRTSAHLKET